MKKTILSTLGLLGMLCAAAQEAPGGDAAFPPSEAEAAATVGSAVQIAEP